MKKRIIPLVIASSCILSACTPEDAAPKNNTTTPAMTVAKEDAIAVVNGKYIPKTSLTQLEQEINQRSPNHAFPKEKLIEELIQRQLLIQEATNKQLDKGAEYIERLETVKNSLLSQAAIQNFLKSNPVTDAELEAEYTKNISASGKEYKARHILLKSEEEAKAVIKELAAGADFVELAKTKSTGPSGPQGGDLGWFTAAQMVAPFSEAAIVLEDGKFTTEPVQTQFGWHIILKEGARDLPAPSFESVKEKIRPALQRNKMQSFMEGLRQQAKVEILLPKEVEVKKPESIISPTAVVDDKKVSKATEKTVEVTKDSNATEAVEKVIETTAPETIEAIKEIEKKVTDTVSTTETTKKVEQLVEKVTKEVKPVAIKAVEEIQEKVTATESAVKETLPETTKKTMEVVTP
jgi:peptidyl-prolyl cis-trans isomerase C